ncbi:hypothetical protein KCTC52924_02827 [Arenibacter antarcticus]
MSMPRGFIFLIERKSGTDPRIKSVKNYGGDV